MYIYMYMYAMNSVVMIQISKWTLIDYLDICVCTK